MGLGLEPHREGDLHDRQILLEQLLGPRDALLQEVVVWPQPCGGTELGGEVHARELGRRAHVGQRDGFVQMSGHKFGHALQTPFGQKTARPPGGGRAGLWRLGASGRQKRPDGIGIETGGQWVVRQGVEKAFSERGQLGVVGDAGADNPLSRVEAGIATVKAELGDFAAQGLQSEVGASGSPTPTTTSR